MSVDDEALSAYVKAMAKNYNTAYGNRTLDTSYGQTVTIDVYKRQAYAGKDF